MSLIINIKLRISCRNLDLEEITDDFMLLRSKLSEFHWAKTDAANAPRPTFRIPGGSITVGFNLIIDNLNYSTPEKLENIRRIVIRALGHNGLLSKYYIDYINHDGVITNYPEINLDELIKKYPVKLIFGESHDDIALPTLIKEFMPILLKLEFNTFFEEQSWSGSLDKIMLNIETLLLMQEQKLIPKKFDEDDLKARAIWFEIYQQIQQTHIKFVGADSRAHVKDGAEKVHLYQERRDTMLTMSYLSEKTSGFGRVGSRHIYGMQNILAKYPDLKEEVLFVRIYSKSPNTQEETDFVNAIKIEYDRLMPIYLYDTKINPIEKIMTEVQLMILHRQYILAEIFRGKEPDREKINTKKLQLMAEEKEHDDYFTKKNIESSQHHKLFSMTKKYSVTLHTHNGILSPSFWATPEQPYGPYKDHYCCPADFITEQALKNQVVQQQPTR